jgi:hypothetical protein
MSALRTQIENAIGQSINEDRAVTVPVPNIDAAQHEIEISCAGDDGKVDRKDVTGGREVWNTGTVGWRLKLVHAG